MDHQTYGLVSTVSIPAVRSTDATPAFPPVSVVELAARLRSTLGGRAEACDNLRGEPTLPPELSAADGPWRLVLPARTLSGPSSKEILEALTPLLARRRALPPLVFMHQSDGDVYAAVASWADAYATEIDETVYFLLAGDTGSMPFALGEHLSIGKVVGRLSLPTAAAYAAYAEKVIHAEERMITRPTRPLLTLATESDPATSVSRRLVIEPILEYLAREHAGVARSGLVSEHATWRELMARLTREGSMAPSLWLAACHGVEERDPCHPAQGALSDQLGTMLTAQGIAGLDGPFLQDGVAILFACNGAGTPRYRDWRRQLPEMQASEPPIDRSALLPEALLAHRAGPLAIVAHDDILFGHGLTDTAGRMPTGVASPGLRPLVDLVSALLRGVPVGMSMRRFRRAMNESEGWLNLQLRRRSCLATALTPVDDERLVATWMRWMDTRNWVVLGDPRVCLEGAQGRISLREAWRN